MKKHLLQSFVFIVFLFIFSTTGLKAQDKTPVEESSAQSEVETLKQRVAILEKQNSEMLRILQTINAKLEKNEVAAAPKIINAVNQPEPIPQQPAAPKVEAAKPPETIKWNEITAGGSKIKLYGFLRLDAVGDSQRPNNPQAPQFITSPDASGNKAGAGNFGMTAKFTRLGIDFTGPRVAKLGDAKLSGRYEMDFFGTFGAESRANARIRFAWMKLNWEHASVVIGQDWQIVAPLLAVPNQHTDMFYVGNVGDRRPLIKTEWKQKVGAGNLFLQGGIGATGTSDSEDLDADGFRDGETSKRPNIEGRVAYAQSLWVKDKPMTIGFGGLYGWEKTIKPIAGRTDFNPKLVAFDYVLPLTKKIDLRGENWKGSHLTDFRGGINQAVNLATGREIRSRGGWSELKLTANSFYSFHTGLTDDDPLDGDLPVNARTRNRSGYFGTRVTPSANFTFGFDFLRWKTDYKGLSSGIDNRVNLIFQYNF
jgi:hypothetical protein